MIVFFSSLLNCNSQPSHTKWERQRENHRDGEKNWEMKKSGVAEKKRVRRSSSAIQNGARDPNSDTPPRVCLPLSLSPFLWSGFSHAWSKQLNSLLTLVGLRNYILICIMRSYIRIRMYKPTCARARLCGIFKSVVSLVPCLIAENGGGELNLKFWCHSFHHLGPQDLKNWYPNWVWWVKFPDVKWHNSNG